MSQGGIVFPEGFVPVLSAELHREPTEDHNLWQFVMELEDFTKKKGEKIQVNGPLFLAEVSDPDTDRQVASLGAKVSANAAQTLDVNQQEFALKENLLPNAIQAREYEAAHSFIDVARLNGAALAVDYFRWRDKLIRTRMHASTYLAYAGQATADNNLDNTSARDQYTMGTFVKGAARLAKRFIPRFPDGKYVCIVDPAIEATIYENQKVLDAMTRALAAQTWAFKGELGDYAGIRFVRNNNFPTINNAGSGGNLVASRATMFGSGTYGLFPMGTADNLLSKDKIEFYGGAASPISNGPIVNVRGMNVEARLNEVTDYQRFQEMIWISHEVYGVLDPNPGSGKTVGTDSRFIENFRGLTILT